MLVFIGMMKCIMLLVYLYFLVYFMVIGIFVVFEDVLNFNSSVGVNFLLYLYMMMMMMMICKVDKDNDCEI